MVAASGVVSSDHVGTASNIPCRSSSVLREPPGPAPRNHRLQMTPTEVPIATWSEQPQRNHCCCCKQRRVPNCRFVMGLGVAGRAPKRKPSPVDCCFLERELLLLLTRAVNCSSFDSLQCGAARWYLLVVLVSLVNPLVSFCCSVTFDPRAPAAETRVDLERRRSPLSESTGLAVVAPIPAELQATPWRSYYCGSERANINAVHLVLCISPTVGAAASDL